MESKYASALKSIIGKVALPAAIVGTGTYAGIRGVKDLKNQKIDQKASKYDRSIARNLRKGNLTNNNLSDEDMSLVDNMYKIASIDKEAFAALGAFGHALGAAFNVSYGLGTGSDVKSNLKKNKLEFNTLKNQQYKL